MQKLKNWRGVRRKMKSTKEEREMEKKKEKIIKLALTCLLDVVIRACQETKTELNTKDEEILLE